MKIYHSLLKPLFILVLLSLCTFSIGAIGMEEQTEPSRQFKIWWYEPEDSAMAKSWNWALDELERLHPDVEILFELKAFEQIMETANMVLNSDDVPDIIQTNKGNATLGVLVKNGLLLSLEDIAQQKGWLDIVGPSFQTTCRYDENGLMGDEGELWAITTYGEFVMIYYNKDMFARYGLSVPETFEEFEAVCEAFVNEGIIPITAGGADKWPVTQNFYELALYKADRKFISDYQFLKDDINFLGPEFSYAANKLKEQVDKGFYDPGVSGITYEDSNFAFFTQLCPMILTGSWLFGGVMANATDFDWGIFLLPGKKYNTGSGGNVFVVPKNAKNKELAYEFISLTLTPEAQTIMAREGGIPVGTVDMEAIENDKVKELNQLFNQIKDNDGLAFYPDWPIPDGWSIFGGAIQELMAGQKTPEETLQYMSDEYYDYKNSLD
jgi:raffinose/stachyose/melibiose transport system substrate-binding protein